MISTRHVAHILSVEPRTVYQWVKAGKLKLTDGMVSRLEFWIFCEQVFGKTEAIGIGKMLRFGRDAWTCVCDHYNVIRNTECGMLVIWDGEEDPGEFYDRIQSRQMRREDRKFRDECSSGRIKTKAWDSILGHRVRERYQRPQLASFRKLPYFARDGRFIPAK